MKKLHKEGIKKMMRNILQKAIDTYGYDAQMQQAQEEATELALAIRKYNRFRTDENLENLAGEIADVFIMNEQVKMMIPDLENLISEQVDFKLGRLKKRLEKL
jgi:NTP pyrophosphatase (non-canonical NTP hydrolase)